MSIRLVNYESKYKDSFKNLNKEWIEKYFIMEAADYKSLDNPEDYILQPGGEIIVALYNENPVGVCALIKSDHEKYDFELAKMAVDPKYHGKGIGILLGEKIIERAVTRKAKCIFLESNTLLNPAINLYRKLDFTEVKGFESPYKRADIQMELILNS